MTALHALVVVQNLVINLFANRRAGETTGDAAKQTAEKGAGNTAHRDTDGAADYSQHCAGLRSRQGTGSSTGRPAGSANQTTCLLSDIFRDDSFRVAARARGIHT